MTRKARISVAIGCVTAAVILALWPRVTSADYWTPPNCRLLHDDGFARYYEVSIQDEVPVLNWIHRRMPHAAHYAAPGGSGGSNFRLWHDSQVTIAVGSVVRTHDGYPMPSSPTSENMEVQVKPMSWDGFVDRIRSLLP